MLDQALEGRAMTPAMRDTPGTRLEQRARYGHWDYFPVNPHRWYEKLRWNARAVIADFRVDDLRATKSRPFPKARIRL